MSHCIVLYCIVLFCIVFYCIVLYCIVLYCIVFFCIVLYCTVLYFFVLYCILLYFIVLYCTVLYCIVKQHNPLGFGRAEVDVVGHCSQQVHKDLLAVVATELGGGEEKEIMIGIRHSLS